MHFLPNVSKIANYVLPQFQDVVYLGHQTIPMLESLKPPPEESVGNLTGDYGKQVGLFLEKCIEEGLLLPKEIGSVVDVGGQNSMTVQRVSKTLGAPLSSLIIDINSITPALQPYDQNIRYAIGDAYTFFTSDSYEKSMKTIINDGATFFLFNNMLNVLKPEDGWQTLKATWARLRSGDYLFISGLVPEQLKSYDLIPDEPVDGIIGFYRDTKKRRFYKSTLLPNFPELIEKNLENAQVIKRESFEQEIEDSSSNLMPLLGYRILALRKA